MSRSLSHLPRPRDAPKCLVGGLFVAVGAVHFVRWSIRSAFAAALGRGDVAIALGALVDYLTVHPAYPLLLLAGVVLLARGVVD